MRVKYLLATAAAVLTAGAANAQVTDGVIKLGVMNDQSGLYADVSGPGGTWAAKKAVADSGIEARGFKVEVVFADHQNKPDIGSNVARQWYDVDKVDAIVDVPTSSVALAINNITKEKNKVFIGSGPATSDLTGPACSPNTAHWTYDTWALANGTGKAIVQTGGKSWYFVTADYAFGHALERDTSNVVKANGGTVVGAVRHPFPGTDFSSFLLQAQASKAQIVAFANAGGDTINSIKQAAEFGIVDGGQKLAGMLMFITDVHSLGLKTAQGLNFTTAWYWDANDNNRAFAKEFAAANGGKMPTMVHAGIYSGVIHYLKAVEALKSDADGVKVVDKMKELPSEDKLFGKGVLRKDGRHIHPMYLVEVKKPSESKYAWDYLHVKSTIPADQAFRPMSEGNCPLVK